ncbi:putative AAA+ ATPase domain-containing protein [Seiridium cardinale]
MCAKRSISTINGNIATGNSVQNYSIFNGDTYTNVTLRLEAPIEAFQKIVGLQPDPKIRKYLESWASSEANPEPQNPNGETLHEFLRQKRDHSSPEDDILRQRLFPALYPLKYQLRKAKGLYNNDGRSVIDAFEEAHIETLGKWFAAPESTILVINGCENQEESKWTTNLLLELTILVDRAMKKLDDSNATTALVWHFCSQEAGPAPSRAHILVQDLIIQIIEAYPAKFEDPNKDGLTFENLAGVSKDISRLWDMLENLIRRAGIRTLVIMVDHIESMFNKYQEGEYPKFFGGLKKFLCSTEGNIMVKVVVTSRSLLKISYLHDLPYLWIEQLEPPIQTFYLE